jgi:hypothetical protein
LSLLVMTIAVLEYSRLNRTQGSSAGHQPVRDTAIANPDSSTLPPTLLDEVLRYYLQVESDTGRAERVAISNPVVRGRWLKFHFAPSQRGYLYIIAPGERAASTMFLTVLPNPAWGVRSDWLADENDYSFPSRRDKWIEFACGASPRTYTIIFTPESLAQPGFLAEAANRNLTATEEGEMVELRKRFGQHVRVERQSDQSIIALPAERANDTPILLKINLPLEPYKERGQR